MTEKKITSIKHADSTRVHTPSSEEQGYEQFNPKVQVGKNQIELELNPVTTRGQDPELFWMNKYGNDDREELLKVDIRSLYRHEHIAPETLIKNLYRIVEDETSPQPDLFGSINELFGNALEREELDKISDYYTHQDGWTNRLIQGDSHLVMASLLEREGMANSVQMIYMDPPYGIKYGSNWQIKLNNRDVKDGNDEHLTGEPEVIKAFRDTWELGIHSYLSYIRDRLLIAKELLTESGSCFVQISDENVHLVRNVMDEVFGSENFVSQISFIKTAGKMGTLLDNVNDFIIWFAKDKSKVKFRQLYGERSQKSLNSGYTWLEEPDGKRYRLNSMQLDGIEPISDGKRFITAPLVSQSGGENSDFEVHLEGKSYKPSKSAFWKTNQIGFSRLEKLNRLIGVKNTLAYVRYADDFPVVSMNNFWADTQQSTFAAEKHYVVQTYSKVIQRCILMTTDPGDLVLDPTCGSGTTAFVAEQFGRRWITTDTSRIALNIAKTRLMTATFPYYKLYSESEPSAVADGLTRSIETGDNKGQLQPPATAGGSDRDIRQGFVYKTVPHITLKSLANDEPPATETLYDKPEIDPKRMRVCGAFTVETLQNFEPISPTELDDEKHSPDSGQFEETIKQHLVSTGVKNGRKDEQVVFTRIELLSGEYLNAEGFYMNGTGEKKAYFYIGPKFGTVSKTAVNEAIKECRNRGDANWLIILGFSFESNIQGGEETTSFGKFEVTKARIHDDLLQDGLKKKVSKSVASFVTIGEPDIILHRSGETATIEIQGLDIYDPIKDEVKARDLHDIAYWMVDDNYDGSNFVVKQIYFCGGDKDEFKKWRKGLESLVKDRTRVRAEKTLKIELDEEAFDAIYGYKSLPIKIKSNGQKIAIRVLSQFGEESMRVFQA
jgi:adenine-specific DNA-methyltransferase